MCYAFVCQASGQGSARWLCFVRSLLESLRGIRLTAKLVPDDFTHSPSALAETTVEGWAQLGAVLFMCSQGHSTGSLPQAVSLLTCQLRDTEDETEVPVILKSRCKICSASFRWSKTSEASLDSREGEREPPPHGRRLREWAATGTPASFASLPSSLPGLQPHGPPVPRRAGRFPFGGCVLPRPGALWPRGSSLSFRSQFKCHFFPEASSSPSCGGPAGLPVLFIMLLPSL